MDSAIGGIWEIGSATCRMRSATPKIRKVTEKNGEEPAGEWVVRRQSSATSLCRCAVGAQLPFVAVVGDEVASFDAGPAHRHLDRAAVDGKRGGKPRNRDLFVCAIEVRCDLARTLVLPVPDVDGVDLVEPEERATGELPSSKPLEWAAVTSCHPFGHALLLPRVEHGVSLLFTALARCTIGRSKHASTPC
ncbi:hypothetical protein ACLTEW_17705 [Gordonia lacunae]|uniref:hypothetical protein n=1 Tax=Gordonia lacunae TaxID=417102 RepID=UPI0039E479A0